MRDPPSHFWNFSLSIYSKDGVADECLRAQDRWGIDVNLLLFAAYLGARGVTLSELQWRNAIDLVVPWRTKIVDRLRIVRRETKGHVRRYSVVESDIERLYGKIKQVELDAERIEHAVLEEWSKTIALEESSEVGCAIADNVATLVRLSVEKGLPPHMFRRLIEEAVRRSH